MLVCTQIARRACSNADSDVEKKVWGEVGEAVFLTSSQAMLTGLVPGATMRTLAGAGGESGCTTRSCGFPKKRGLAQSWPLRGSFVIRETTTICVHHSQGVLAFGKQKQLQLDLVLSKYM